MPNPTLCLPHTFYSSKEEEKELGIFKKFVRKVGIEPGTECRIQVAVEGKSVTFQYNSWRTSEFKES